MITGRQTFVRSHMGTPIQDSSACIALNHHN